MKLKTLICDLNSCNKKFKQKTGTQKYCSPRCNWTANYLKVNKLEKLSE